MITSDYKKCPECSINPFIEELVDYLGDSFSHERMHYAATNLANKWREEDRNSAESVEKFYEEAHDYLYDLTSWHGSDPGRRKWTDEIKKYIIEHNHRVVLDFGCGIGNDGLALSDIEGMNVDFVDVPDCPCLDYLVHRIQNRNLEGRFNIFKSERFIPPKHYDFIICLDVVEHLYDSEELVSDLFDNCEAISMTCQGVDEWHPMHLKENLKFTQSDFINSFLDKHGFRNTFTPFVPIYERIK